MSGRVYTTKHPTVRFWAFVDKETCVPCWKWTGAADKRGYGRFRPGPRGVPMIGAHRFAFEQYGGVVGPGQVVMHSCDNPWCVNPTHLSAGTNKENTADAMRKGRMRHFFHPGPNPRRGKGAKLDATKAAEIKKLNHLPRRNVAEMYGVSPQLISNIRSGRAWRHV